MTVSLPITKFNPMPGIFKKTVSFFKTTLAQGISDSGTSLVANDVPGGTQEYPTWGVIENGSSGAELVYIPTAPVGNTFTIVRGLDPEADADTDAGSAFRRGHSANVDFIIGPVHRHWNEVVKVMVGTNGTGSTNLRIGDDTDSNVTIYAQNADANKPFVRYDAATNKWLISNDGVNTYDISSGGSGLSAGNGLQIITSVISTNLRSSGGLRNNQGVGSVQMDVDPAIVARLDTANTWAAIQDFRLTSVKISTPTAAEDAVRKDYVDTRLVSNNFADGSDGPVDMDGTNTYAAFASKSGSTYTLTRDVFATTLRVRLGSTLKMANFRVFANTSILNEGTMSNDGVAGTSASGETQGTGGTATAAGSMPANIAGGNGANGGVSNAVGNNGSAGSNSSRAVSATTSGAGGNGGTSGTNAGGTGGASGTNSGTALNLPRSLPGAYMLFDVNGTAIAVLNTAPGAGGGGGGGGSAASVQEPAGGGGGASGGFGFIAAPDITNSGTIQCNGGSGGNGATGTGNNVGGGGGGGAGSGGWLIIIRRTLTNTGNIRALAGSPGIGGSGIGTGVGGATGGTATAGVVTQIVSA